MKKPFHVETSTMIIDSNGVVYEKENSRWHPINNEHDGQAILKYINTLTLGKYYKLCNWHKSSVLSQERAFIEIKEEQFTTNLIRNYKWNYFKYVLPVSNCKECGFETDLSVCPNCGEWQ